VKASLYCMESLTMSSVGSPLALMPRLDYTDMYIYHAWIVVEIYIFLYSGQFLRPQGRKGLIVWVLSLSA
jgi:hypothetical protein